MRSSSSIVAVLTANVVRPLCVVALIGLSTHCGSGSSAHLSESDSASRDAAESEVALARLQSLPRHAELFGDGVVSPVDSDSLRVGQIANVSLASYDSSVKSQGQRSTCSAFATVAAIENLTKQRQGFSFDLSEEQLWSYYQRPWEPDALQNAATYYLTTSQNWPYDPRLGQVGSPQIGDVDAAGLVRLAASVPLDGFAGVGQALSRAHPVIAVVDVTRSLLNVPSNGVVAAGTALTGRAHVMELVGIAPDASPGSGTGGGYVTLKNSWGSASGDHGYVYLPFNYCTGGVSCAFWEVSAVAFRP